MALLTISFAVLLGSQRTRDNSFARRVDDVKADAHAEPVQGANLTPVCFICFWVFPSDDLFVSASRSEYFTRIAVVNVQDLCHFLGEGLH